jgi:hypothetical protein
MLPSKITAGGRYLALISLWMLCAGAQDLSAWREIASFRPPVDLQQALLDRGPQDVLQKWHWQRIEGVAGSDINLETVGLPALTPLGTRWVTTSMFQMTLVPQYCGRAILGF